MGNRIGQAVEAVVIRGGEQVTLSVEISERE
jgi:S1-C subfamily serine protease